MASSSRIARASARTLLQRSPRATLPLAHFSRTFASSSRLALPANDTQGTSDTAQIRRELLRRAAPEDPNAKNDNPAFAKPTAMSPSPPPPRTYSPLTVKIVSFIGRMAGYNSERSVAIRVTSDLYDDCAKQAEREADFFYGSCQLPPTYQTWFMITTMHIHLLQARFRALDTPKTAKVYNQELINHFFIDAESRMRMRFGVRTQRLVTGYMKDMHTQQRGAILGYDEALSYSVARETDRERFGDADAALATAIWRNLWGASGWGRGVGGVKRKVRGVDKESDEEKKKRKAAERAGQKVSDPSEGRPDLARDAGMTAVGRGERHVAEAIEAQKKGMAELESLEHDDHTPGNDLDFALALERLVRFYRRETVRLAELSNAEIRKGRIGPTTPGTEEEKMEELRSQPFVTKFSAI